MAIRQSPGRSATNQRPQLGLSTVKYSATAGVASVASSRESTPPSVRNNFASSACRTRISSLPHVPVAERVRSSALMMDRTCLSSFPLPCISTRAAKASALGGHSYFQTPDTRLCTAIAAAPKSRSPLFAPQNPVRQPEVLKDALPLLSDSLLNLNSALVLLQAHLNFACILCLVLSILGEFLGYETLYLFLVVGASVCMRASTS